MASSSKDSDKLKKILSKLSYLDLNGQITAKQPHASNLGSTCEVFSAWSQKHDKKVAVKQIRAFLSKDLAFANTLAREIRIWATLEHANVQPLMGFITEGENAMPSLISEWMCKGTMFDFMKTFPKSSITTCKLLHGIAEGLAYLHSKRVIHADLKSQNILISENDEPLLTDFGLSLALMHSTLVTSRSSYTTKGTIRWMAKELVDPGFDGPSAKHNEKTDIWAFGMVTYEILTWNIPYWNIPIDARVILRISKGELPQKPLDFPKTINNGLWALCESCWSSSSLRPSAKQIQDLIVDIIVRDVQLKLSLLCVPAGANATIKHEDLLELSGARGNETDCEGGTFGKLEQLSTPDVLSHQERTVEDEHQRFNGECSDYQRERSTSTLKLSEEMISTPSPLLQDIVDSECPFPTITTPPPSPSPVDVVCTCSRAHSERRAVRCRGCVQNFCATCNDFQVGNTTSWLCRNCASTPPANPPQGPGPSAVGESSRLQIDLSGVGSVCRFPTGTTPVAIPRDATEPWMESRIVTDAAVDVPPSSPFSHQQHPNPRNYLPSVVPHENHGVNHCATRTSGSSVVIITDATSGDCYESQHLRDVFPQSGGQYVSHSYLPDANVLNRNIFVPSGRQVRNYIPNVTSAPHPSQSYSAKEELGIPDHPPKFPIAQNIEQISLQSQTQESAHDTNLSYPTYGFEQRQGSKSVSTSAAVPSVSTFMIPSPKADSSRLVCECGLPYLDNRLIQCIDCRRNFHQTCCHIHTNNSANWKCWTCFTVDMEEVPKIENSGKFHVKVKGQNSTDSTYSLLRSTKFRVTGKL